MNVTFIIRNLTETTLQELQGMESRAAFDRLNKWALGDLQHCVSVKFGPSNAFRDRVEANYLLKAGCSMAFKIEPRKGYKLATFTLSMVTVK